MKIFYLLLFFPLGLFGQSQIVNVGVSANDHTGDPLRTAFQKVNTNTYDVRDTFASALQLRDILPTWLGIYNVKDYGAVGDSITDDTDAIQDCIDAVPDEGGTVYFPQGIYRIEGTIYITTPVHLLGVPVGMLVFSRPADIDFWYNAGSVLMSKGSAKAMIDINTGRGPGSVEFRASVIENLHFYDVSGFNDTLLVVRMTNYVRVKDCTFDEGAVGLKIDALVEDASWMTIQDNMFRHNNVGLSLEANVSAAAVPIVNVYGGMFLVQDNQRGVYAEKPSHTTFSGFKMDINGTNARGFDIDKGTKISLTDIKFEMDADDSTTMAIRSRTNISMTGIGVEGTDFGTGVWLQSGVSTADPHVGSAIVNSNFSGLDYGVIVDDTTAGMLISNSYFNPNINVASIKLRPNSGSHLLHNIIIGNPIYSAGGIQDSSTNTTMTNINYISGGTRRYYDKKPPETGALTDGVPTDAELDAEFGFTAVQAGRGFRRTIRDTNGTGLLYIVESDGTNWFYIATVKAL